MPTTINMELKESELNLYCPYCDDKINLLGNICPHLLVKYNMAAGGYIYVRDDFEEIVDEDNNFESIPFAESDLIFEFSDDLIGNLVRIAVRNS